MITFIGSSAWDRTMVVESVAGDIYRIADRYENPGGNALNAALVSALFGEKTGIVTALGKDKMGSEIKKLLEERKIKKEIINQEKTKIADIQIMPDQTRSIFVDKAGAPNSRPSSLAEKMIKDSKIVDFYPGLIRDNFSYWYQISKEKTRAISGIHILNEIAEKRTWDIITESKELIEKPTDEELYSLRAKIFALTDGSRGGEWWEPEAGWKDYPSFSLNKKGDSTGSGDAFRAGLLVGISRGLSSREAIFLASWAGAKAAETKGVASIFKKDLRNYPDVTFDLS